MNQEIKEKWVAALRSGEYAQTKGLLRDANGFCCLGVLCDVYYKETGESIWESEQDDDDIRFTFDNQPKILPNSVMEWAGLPDNNPEINGRNNYAAVLNDDGTTFNEIADLIEKNL
jgi:hypothetical protein